MTHPIAVLAGTPVDTQMGVDFLTGAGLSGTAFPLSADPRQQTAFQISSAAEKQARALAVLRQATEQGCEKAFVYCNSLSASVDFPALSRETGMKIVTPLDVYRSLAPRYRRLAFIAANAQGLAGIERVLLAANPALDTLSAAALTVVLAIEQGEDPDQLVEHHHLAELANWFAACGMEALLLGCTHFPYFKEALARRTSLPLIDPAREMLDSLEFPADVTDRVCFLVGHHHTYTGIDGMDYQILVEADFLVNLFENETQQAPRREALKRIFKTGCGRTLCRVMFGLEEETQ